MQLTDAEIRRIQSMHGMYRIQKVGDMYCAVFKDEYEAFEYDVMYPEHFQGCQVMCVGKAMYNAYVLGTVH